MRCMLRDSICAIRGGICLAHPLTLRNDEINCESAPTEWAVVPGRYFTGIRKRSRGSRHNRTALLPIPQ